MADEWAADVPISMPEPNPYEGRVPMFGMVFTEYGLWHDLNQDEYEDHRRPYFAPLPEHTYPRVEHNDG